MTITEPMTLATDYMLGAYTLWLATRLYRHNRRLRDVATGLWAAAFLIFALAAFAGGTWHGFTSILEGAVLDFLWTLTLCLAAAAHLLILTAVLHAYTSGRLRQALVVLACGKFVAFILWTLAHDDFRLVVYDAVMTMLPIIALAAWAAWTQQAASAPWLLLGISLSLLGALIQQGRIALHPAFNHNDLFHVVQAVAMYFLLRAGLLLRDYSTQSLLRMNPSTTSDR